jgi:alkylhydroperoxidase/carboxymuconolactone decarboxylase family protein YurZ
MPRSYSERAFYDFEENYRDAVDLIRRTFGDERADKVLADKGKNTRSDFTTAISWGWFFHRPILTPQQRSLVLIGNDISRMAWRALRDHVQWGVAEGLHREKVREAVFTMSIYGGLANCELASETVEELLGELDKLGWQPFVAPGPLPAIEEHNFYDFEQNFTDGVDVSIAVFGTSRGGDRETRLSRMGASDTGDFQSIHWGWMMHRPFLLPAERVMVLIGSDTGNKGYLALKDHVPWGLTEGLTRDEVREAMLMLMVFNGWPATREANNAVSALFEELDKKGEA